jgi:hypothetical protein
MDQSEERRRLNTEYVQAVLNAGVSLAAWHVAVTASAGGSRYWVMGPDGKTLDPFVSTADVATTNNRIKRLTGLDSSYAELIAFHRRASSDDDPQLEPSYRPAGSRKKVVRHPMHAAFLRDTEGWEKDEDEGLSL